MLKLYFMWKLLKLLSIFFTCSYLNSKAQPGTYIKCSQINEEFSGTSTLSNWDIVAQSSGTSFNVVNGEGIVHINGGSNGSLGFVDQISIQAVHGGSYLASYENREIHFNINEIQLDSFPNNNHHLIASYWFNTYNSDFFFIALRGYHVGTDPFSTLPNNSYFHTLEVHTYTAVGITQVIVDTLTPNQLYNLDFRLLKSQGQNWQLYWKESSAVNFEQYTIPLLDGYGTTNFGFYSQDGGNTFQNGIGTWGIDYYKVYNKEVQTTLNATICPGDTLDGYYSAGTYIDTFNASTICDSIRTLNLTITPWCNCINSRWQAQYAGIGWANPFLSMPSFLDTINEWTFLPPLGSPNPYYWSHFKYSDTMCLSTDFSIEYKLKTGPPSGISAYDTEVYFESENGICRAKLVGASWGQPYTSIEINNSTITTGQSFLVFPNLSNWSVIKFEFMSNSTLNFYMDGVMFYSAPYSGSICEIRNLGYAFKGSGYCDWIKITKPNNDTLYFEDFKNCNSIASFPNNCFSNTSTINYTIPTCINDTLLLFSTTSSNIVNSYSWSGPNGFTSNLQNPVLPNTSVLNNGYYYLTTNVNSCIPSSTDSILIQNIGLPIIDTINNSICQGQSYMGYTTTTSWSDTLTASSGCDSIIHYNLTVNPLPNVGSTPVNPAICLGQSVALSGTGANTYTWSGGVSNGIAFSPANTTTYTVTGTDNNGCSSTATKIVVVNPLPSVTTSVLPNDSVCAGSSIALSGNGANTYTWSGGISNNAPFAITNSNTYTVTGTNANGCSSTASISITVHPLPIIIANGPNAVCSGSNVTLSGSGASTFTWSGGISNNSPFTITNTSTYTVTGTDINGCTNTATKVITVNPLPIVVANGPNSACNVSSITLFGSGANTYTWSGGVSNNSPFTISNTTTYTVTGTDVNGCSNTASKTVTVNALPTLSVLPVNPSICLNQSVNLTAGGASTYVWSPSSGLNQTTGTTVTASPISTTTYTITGTDANGCSNTLSNTVAVNPLPNLSTTPSSATLCIGDSVTLNINGASTYTWSPGAGLNQSTGSQVKASPIATTTYTITGTNANGCINTQTISVTVNPLPIIIANGPNSACTGSSITLFGSGANTYTWSGGVINNSPFTISNTTTYTVTGTDANGCSNTASKTVTVNALPTLSVLPVNPTICLNQSINLTAGGASTYAWSPASGLNQTTGTTVTASPTSTTTYTITGTDANGCSNTISNTVAVNPLPTLSATPSSATLCIGDSVTLNINGANTYTWSPSAGLNQSTGSQVKASPMATTTYTITGTNANGCTNTQTISVTVNPLPVLSILPANPTICLSESITLTANGATSYTWTPNTGLNNTSSPIVIANPTATQIYTITGTDTNGCVNTISTTLTVNPLPVLSVLPVNPSICIGDAVNMSVNGASTYTWSPSGGLNTTIGNSVQSNPTVTTSYQVIGTTALGCKDSLVNTVTVNPLPILSTTPLSTTICQGQSTNLTINGANTYAWTPGGSLNIAQGSSVTASPYLTTTYTIVGTDVNSCTSVAQILVNVNPSYNRFDTLELCQGMSYTFGSQTITTAGNYIHTFQTGLSCDSTVNLHVKLYDKPVSNFNLADHACVNEPVLIQNNWQSPQASYAWNVGDGILTGNTPSINVIWTIPGTKLVSLEVATQSPCIPELFMDTIQVHQAQANIIVSDADTFFCIYDQIKLQTPNINGYSYMWSPSLYFNSTSYIAEGVVKEPVTVKVYVKDQWGCEAEDSKYLDVQPCCNAYLPNSFTPNGDGLNDVFRIIGEGNYHILDFYVANRWGNIIFRTIDQNVGWDGKIQGVEQSIDTYYYFLKYECANGDKRVIKGDLTLLR
jgi:gliding motility-associated-like protein